MQDRIVVTRRRVVLWGAGIAVAGCAAPLAAPGDPIVFVHGNGDGAAVWTTTIWRFESNGWPRERLHAIELPYPLGRDDDGREQPGRSSTAEHRAHLAAEVRRALAATGSKRVVLVGLSRGGYAIRDYVGGGDGAATVSAVVLGGVPNHGIYADATRDPGNEFNGAGPYLRRLNAPRGSEGLEVVPGVRWLTIRSNDNDKYAQPDGVWLGQRGMATNVGFDGPALKGATNVVLAGVDHRETALGARAFAETWTFLTGAPPATIDIVAEPLVVLDGSVTGLGVDNRQGSSPSNLPLVGATIEVYAVDPATGERRGAARHSKTIGADGRWGPFATEPTVHHEFVVTAPGYATTHVYRSPFPRSSRVVGLRAARLADADRAAGIQSLVVLTRPRGYFGVPRDRIVLDGTSPPAGIPSGVAGVAEARLRVTDRSMRSVVGAFNGERIAGLAWPVEGNHVVFLELTQ